MNVAIILTLGRDDSLADTLLDGFRQMTEVTLRTSEEEGFFDFAKNADLILLVYGKKKTNVELAEQIGRWNRTVFIDGSEVGKNFRYDFSVQRDVLSGAFTAYGGIRYDMLKKCALYFRREKPYLDGMIPLPFGIESSYVRWDKNIKKDIDFCCVFGQDEYPLLRRYVKEELENFCKKNNFICWTKKTDTPEEFHQILARSKVGISVGGGGFDTMRFWEILGNNCLLMTETIDIHASLDYKRIYQFNNLFDFRDRLQEVAESFTVDDTEYQKILAEHSSKARAMTVISEAEKRFKADAEYKNLCSILVSSFDGNEDIWKPFFTLLFTHWPDCPYKIYLITNNKTYDDPRVTTISIGEDRGWASNTKKALAQISTPYVLFLLEDFLLHTPVDSEYLKRLLDLMRTKHAAYLRLNSKPMPDQVYDTTLNVGLIKQTSDNRTSLHAAYWDVSVFQSLIKDGENAWQMEAEGTLRSRTLAMPFLSVSKPALLYEYLDCTAVTRGKWIKEAVEFCKSQGIYIDPARPINYALSRSRYFDIARKGKFGQTIKRIPLIGKLIGAVSWKLSQWYVHHQ